jgi:putative ABC transport system permease protein
MRGILPQWLAALQPEVVAVFNLALKNLLQERGRFVLGIVGVAFANLLIMFQMAMVSGTFAQVTNYIDKTHADIWVLQEGVFDITSSTSFVSSTNIGRIRAIDGVENVTGLFLYYTTFRIRSKPANVLLVGFDTDSGIGGPWNIFAGERTVEKGQIIMDRVLAESEGLGLGDEVEISGITLTIVGLSKETSAVATQYIFVAKEVVQEYLKLSTIYNCLLVSCREASDLERIIAEINTIDGINAYTKKQLAENTLQFWGKFLIPLLIGLVLISFLVGMTIIGIIVHNITLHKEKEYGVLLALGAASRDIYKVVLHQGILLGGIGLVCGMVLSLIAVQVANSEIPGMTARIDLRTLAFSVLLTVLIPLTRILRIDPFEIFRG